MDDDSRVVDKGWDLPEYAEQTADDAVTRSISTNPTAEWLVNTMDSVVVPMSTADVVEALRVHKLTDRSLVWRNGMPEWTSTVIAFLCMESSGPPCASRASGP